MPQMKNKHSNHGMIQFPTEVAKLPRPQVDVVVPVFNQGSMVQECVVTMERTTLVPHRTYIVDDASMDESVPQVLNGLRVAYPHLHASRNPQNLGFAPTCNRGAKMGFAPYICFLNTDVVLAMGCIDILVHELEADPQLAIAGPLLTFPAGTNDPLRPAGKVQSCGFGYNITRMPFHRLIGWSAEHPRVQQSRKDLQGITGACMVVRRAFFTAVGGFFEGYGSTFEDAELGVQAVSMGMRVGYFPAARGTHIAGASSQGANVPYQRNAQLFVQRVGRFISYDEHITLGDAKVSLLL